MKTNTRKTLKIYWQHTMQHKFMFFLVLLSIVVASSLQSIVPIYFKDFFDLLAAGVSNTNQQELIHLIVVITILSLLSWACWRIATFGSSYFQPIVIKNLSDYCFSVLHKHSAGFFNDNFVGSLVKKVKWFGKSYEVVADRISWNIVPLATTIIIVSAVLFLKNFYLGLGVLVWIILFLGVNIVFSRYKIKYDMQKSKAETATTAYLADSITNNSTIKLFASFKRELFGFKKTTQTLKKLQQKVWYLDSGFEALQHLLMIILEIGTLLFAVYIWRSGLLTIGDFFLIQSYLVLIFNRVWEFGRMLRNLYESLADAEEMTEIINKPNEIVDVPNAKKLNAPKGEITMSHVNFSYHKKGQAVFEDFNLHIPAGQHLAIVGPSGGGKSTLVKLLVRFLDIERGSITFDGQSIRTVTMESLWQHISFVPQEPILFHRSLMENIRYGKPDATEAEVIAAAKKAHCHEFIEKLPQKYETLVGERGIKLSGGERQRIAIARAILEDAPILILDEATSSLDSEAEHLIQDALKNVMEGKTTLVIAHRLSTIMKMDRIIVIQGGKITEDGTHHDLLKVTEGTYQKLWEIQAGSFAQ